MNRYWLFGSVSYYATGGMCDFIKSFESIDSAIDEAKRRTDLRESNFAEFIEWWHVFDSEQSAIVAENTDSQYGFEEFPRFV
jgi:hypothetical protein